VAADLLANIRSEIDERIAALRPLLDEYDRLSAAAEAFAAVKADGFPSAEHPPEPPSAAPFLGSAEEDLSASAVEEEEDLRGTALDEEIPAGASFVEETLAAASPEEPPAAPTPSPVSSSAFSSSAGADPDTQVRRDVRRGGPWAAGAFAPAMSLRTTPPIQPIRLTPSRAKPVERPSEDRAAFARRAAADERAAFERRFGEADGGHGAEHDGERAGERAGSSFADEPAPAHTPASPSAVRRAILAALEHGSHTTTELVMVTAMRPADVRRGLGVLSDRGEIAKVRRAGDNRAAFALRSALARV
jgi:hypothetical protein